MTVFHHMGTGTLVSCSISQPFLQSTIQSQHMAHVGMAATGMQQVQVGRQTMNVHVPNIEQPVVPSIQALRTTAVDQALVQQRLQELNQQALPH